MSNERIFYIPSRSHNGWLQRSVMTRSDVSTLSRTWFAVALVAYGRGVALLSHVLTSLWSTGQLLVDVMLEQSSGCHQSCMHAVVLLQQSEQCAGPSEARLLKDPGMREQVRYHTG
jgi:hypothetical protein